VILLHPVPAALAGCRYIAQSLLVVVEEDLGWKQVVLGQSEVELAPAVESAGEAVEIQSRVNLGKSRHMDSQALERAL
jgi:hypothetical protein